MGNARIFFFGRFCNRLGGFLRAWGAKKLKEEEPWEKVDIDKIIT